MWFYKQMCSYKTIQFFEIKAVSHQLASSFCIKNGHLWLKPCPAKTHLMPNYNSQRETSRWQREQRGSANHRSNLENTCGASTHQSCDKGHPKMPEVIVQQPAVHYVSKESNASCFTQPVSWFGFCKRRDNESGKTFQERNERKYLWPCVFEPRQHIVSSLLFGTRQWNLCLAYDQHWGQACLHSKANQQLHWTSSG